MGGAKKTFPQARAVGVIHKHHHEAEIQTSERARKPFGEAVLPKCRIEEMGPGSFISTSKKNGHEFMKSALNILNAGLIAVLVTLALSVHTQNEAESPTKAFLRD